MTKVFRFERTIAPVALACIAASVVWSPVASAQTRYTASWASVDTHAPAPEWFQDAKLGIYYHWGAFGTAMYGSEWYPRNMYNRDSGEYRNNVDKYGDPFSDWPYDKFITGGNDRSANWVQFAPMLTSEGGAWDPDEWAQMFVDAGARFAGPVAEHHDGFSHWDSQVNEWNAAAKGPQLDLVALQADAFRNKGLKFLVSMHHAYNFTGYYEWAPTPSDPGLQKLYGKLPNAQEQQLWLDKLTELIDKFMPDIIWQDFNLHQIDESIRLEFLAYYYNAALDANKEVVATYKDGFNDRGEVLDWERGGPADITYPYWLTDDAISQSTWCYTQGMSYYSDAALIHAFIDRVSKNGNLLLNLS
jgi:alpha-L-fucosidase